MWIVRLALRRPYTFVVLAMLILLLSGVTLAQMPTDIYPEINIPVIAAIWNYTGLPPEEMEGRITSQFERAATTTVSGIEHLESQSLAGVAVIKVFLQPGTSVASALAQVAAVSEPILRSMPPGATPPLVMPYSVTDVPILQLGLSSATLREQQIYDLGTNFLRSGLATVQGAMLPLPYGGKQREVVVDLDVEKLFAWSLSPADVARAQHDLGVLQIRFDVEQARLAVRATKATIGAVEDAYINARLQLRLAEGRYESGMGNIIELTDAQTALTFAAGQRVVAEYNLAVARAQLLRALGRD